VFEKLGIIGWNDIEHIVLAALMTDQPVLFFGAHGCCKTDAALMLSKGLFGEDVKFAKYETPLVNTDDLLGYVNTKALMEGRVEYFGTGSSIWEVDVCSFDEINRTNPLTTAKIMELVRTRMVMGRATKLKYVFSSANPPKDYDAMYINKAAASRFVTMRVPDIKTLSKNQCNTILSESLPVDFNGFRNDYNSIANITFNDRDKDKLRDIVLKIVMELKDSSSVLIQPREMKAIYSLLLVTEAISKAGIGIEINEGSKADVVISKIPQAFGVTREDVNIQDIRAKIMSILVGFSLDDPITIAQSALDMFNIVDKNNTLWLARTKDLLEKENDTSILKRSGSILINLLTNKTITDIMFNILMHATVTRYFTLSDDSYSDLLTWDRDSMKQVIASLFME